jgi:hypothetical protein
MPTTTRSAIDLPFNEAVDFFRQKVNVPTERWTDLMNEAHSHGFAVAGAANEAMLGDFREAVDKAISQGTGLAEFRRDFDAIVKKYGWQHTGSAGWRARVIYETNMTTAFSAGRYAQLTAPGMREAFPYWQYNHTPCANPRLQHLAWDGLVLRADDGFWDTCYPPNGWGCRCFVTAVSAGGLRRMGKSAPDVAPGLQYKDWTNKHTGEVMKVPVGVDPGFAYNPGQAWAQGAKLPVHAPDVKPVGGKMPLLARPGVSAVEPHVLDKFIAAPEGAVQVATLGPELVQMLGVKTPRVLLSAETAKKQVDKHPELLAVHYREINALLRTPEVVLRDGEGRLRLMGRFNGKGVTAIIKRTATADEVFVLSFHFIRASAAAGFLARKHALRGDGEAYVAELKRAR